MYGLKTAAEYLTKKLEMPVSEAMVGKIVRRYPVPHARVGVKIQLTTETVEDIGKFILRTHRYGNDWEYPPQEEIWRIAAELREKNPRPPVGASDEYEFPVVQTRPSR